jgi:preprotein translocase subunit YajC
VVTDSGIYGRVVSIKDETVTLVLKKGEIEILKSKILHT